MEIPLPPPGPPPGSNEYSPSHVTSPHSDDDENSASTPKKSAKAVLSKKKASNILKSLKSDLYSAKKTKITNFRSANAKDEEEPEKSAAEIDEELRVEREKIKEKMAAFRSSTDKERKLNIESIIEEEKFEKRKLMPKIDMMPNKAGSSFHQMRIAAGPVDVDLLNQQRAEEAAMRLAEANRAIVNKGPIVCDNFGFVTAQGRQLVEPPPEPKKERSKRHRSRSRSRERKRRKSLEREREAERLKAEEEREMKAVREKYKLDALPASWAAMKSAKISVSDSDFVTLKRAFKQTEEHSSYKKAVTLVKAAEIDPVVKECEKVNNPTKWIEFPLKSIKKTKTEPSIEWCINRRLASTTFLKGRQDYPEAVSALTALVESQKLPSSSTSEELSEKSQQTWYVRPDDFLKPSASGAVFPVAKKAKKKKKSKDLSKEDLVKLLEQDLGKKRKKKKKKKSNNTEEEEEEDEDISKKKKKKKKNKDSSPKVKKSKRKEVVEELLDAHPFSAKLMNMAGYNKDEEVALESSKKSRRRSREDPRSPSPPPTLKKSISRSAPRTPPEPAARSVSPPTDPRLRLGIRQFGPRTPSPPPRKTGPRTPSPRYSRSSPRYRGRTSPPPRPKRPRSPRGSSPHYSRSRYNSEFRLERSVADSTINDADLILDQSMGLISDVRQNNSPKRPSLDERLEKELGIKVRGDNDANGLIPDLSRPPPGYLPNVPQYPQKSVAVDPPEEGRLVRIGNMLQIVPEPNGKTPAVDHESNKAKEMMRKLEEQKRKKEAERKVRREQRLAEMQKRQLEDSNVGNEEVLAVKTSSRILESIEREEDHEAKVLAEAMTSVPEQDSDDNDEDLEDVQSLSAAKRSKQRKKNEIRYISLKPLSKKERKRQQKMIIGDQANAAAEQEPDDVDEDSEDYVRPSPVPLPDADSVKSILHRFGNLDKKSESGKKVLRYADGVLPGQGSPDHHNAPQEPSPPPPASSRKRRKKIAVRIIETKRRRNGSSSDDDEDEATSNLSAAPPPPSGTPMLYHSADFVAKFTNNATQVN